jgi:dsRNA-specific ribonuclease
MWEQNFLGPLVVAKGETAGKAAFLVATERLIGGVGEREGLERALELVERFWNPLDQLGTDVVSVLAYNHPKTDLQEIVQSRGGRPIYSDYVNHGTADATDWSCRLRIGQAVTVEGRARTKSKAESSAAARAIEELSKLPIWKATMDERRAQLIAGMRKRGPWLLRPNIDIDASVAATLQRAYKEKLGWDMDPLVGYVALIDRDTASLRRYRFDFTALECLGSRAINYAITQRAFSLGLEELGVLVRVALQLLAEHLKVSEFRAILGLEGAPHEKMLKDTAQAMVGGLFVTSGPSGFLAAIAQTVDQLTKAASSSSAFDRKTTGTRIEAALGPFDRTIQYTQILQEVAQAYGTSLPDYQFTHSGPWHAASFRCIGRWGSFTGTGTGQSKVAARASAGHDLLKKIAEAQKSGQLAPPESASKREKVK